MVNMPLESRRTPPYAPLYKGDFLRSGYLKGRALLLSRVIGGWSVMPQLLGVERALRRAFIQRARSARSTLCAFPHPKLRHYRISIKNYAV